MKELVLAFERDYEFPRVIVWDALIDPDLVSGWLAEASILPALGGQYDLWWINREGTPATSGRIVLFEPLRRLQVETKDAGRLLFTLGELAGGMRAASTRLRVEVQLTGDVVLDARATTDWLTNLEQLDELLRGHPVDWGDVDRLRG